MSLSPWNNFNVFLTIVRCIIIGYQFCDCMCTVHCGSVRALGLVVEPLNTSDKATGNSLSGIPGNSREFDDPKIPAGIPGNSNNCYLEFFYTRTQQLAAL